MLTTPRRSCSPPHVDTFLSSVMKCVTAVAERMQSNRLPTQWQQDGVHVLHNWPSPTSSASRRYYHWLHEHHANVCGLWSQRLHGLGLVCMQSCPANCAMLFRCSSPVTLHPASSTNCGVPVIDHRACHATFGLLQQHAIWLAHVFDQAPPVHRMPLRSLCAVSSSLSISLLCLLLPGWQQIYDDYYVRCIKHESFRWSLYY